MSLSEQDSPNSPKVLMLGWEFPPGKTGGLGTACFGLTQALNKMQAEVLFVFPAEKGQELAPPGTLPASINIREVLPGRRSAEK